MKVSNNEKPSRAPILLSAFICPGAGQLMQRRWRTGTLYVLCFFTPFGFLITLAAQNIINYYRLGFEFDTYEPKPAISTSKLVLAFGIALVVYLMSLMDTAIAQFRINSKQAKKNILPKTNAS